jgi:hypothetical protein
MALSVITTDIVPGGTLHRQALVLAIPSFSLTKRIHLKPISINQNILVFR